MNVDNVRPVFTGYQSIPNQFELALKQWKVRVSHLNMWCTYTTYEMEEVESCEAFCEQGLMRFISDGNHKHARTYTLTELGVNRALLAQL